MLALVHAYRLYPSLPGTADTVVRRALPRFTIELVFVDEFGSVAEPVFYTAAATWERLLGGYQIGIDEEPLVLTINISTIDGVGGTLARVCYSRL